jgi:hypothetical protein
LIYLQLLLQIVPNSTPIGSYSPELLRYSGQDRNDVDRHEYSHWHFQPRKPFDDAMSTVASRENCDPLVMADLVKQIHCADRL